MMGSIVCENNIDLNRILWEDVLWEFCDPRIVSEYEDLCDEGKERLLDALRALCRHRLYNCTDEGGCEMNNSLLRALRDTVDVTKISQTRLGELLFALKRWGMQETSLDEFEDRVKNQRNRCEENLEFVIDSTSQKRGDSSFKWDELQLMKFDDLELFTIPKGKYLEATIITDCLSEAEITIFIEDESGDIIKLSLFNQISAKSLGNSGSTIANAKFPKHSTIRIAEPFLQIDADGERSVRVDTPCEIIIMNKPVICFEKAISEGEKYEDEHDWLSANELYMLSLRNNPMVNDIIELLCKRADAWNELGDFNSALSDAAAALFLHPDHEAAWDIYLEVLEKCGHTKLISRAEAVSSHSKYDRNFVGEDPDTLRRLDATLQSVFSHHIDSIESFDENHEYDHNDLELLGNHLFTNGSFAEAREAYSHALSYCIAVQDVVTILSKVVVCSMESHCFHTSLSAANACLAIGGMCKFFYPIYGKLYHCILNCLLFLGRTNCLLNLARVCEVSSLLTKSMYNAVGEAKKLGKHIPGMRIQLPIPDDVQSPNGIDSSRIEVIFSPGKGRGLRAKRTFRKDDPVLSQMACVKFINNPAISVQSHTHACRGTHTDYTAVHGVTTRALILSASDHLIALSLSSLYDGTNRKLNKPILSDQIIHLSTRVLPLLSSENLFIPKNEHINLSAPFVNGVIRMNAHGADDSSELFSVWCLMNHAGDHNTTTNYLTHPSVIEWKVTRAHAKIPKGEEITTTYTSGIIVHDDEFKNLHWATDSCGINLLR